MARPMPFLRTPSPRHRPVSPWLDWSGARHRFAGALRFAAVAGAVLALSACADEKYPSLAQRPAERARAQAPAASPSPMAAEPVIPALRAQLDALLDSARKAHKAFLARRADAERLVDAAQGAAVPSNAWAAANEALAELDTNRTDLAVAQARLEQIYIDDRLNHALVDGGADTMPVRPVATAIATARDEVLELVGIEDTALDELKARMPG